MNINLELYKVFCCVAENKSITRAASELLISQPAISKSIKTLEDQIGTVLFNRKRDGVTLTEAGESLYSKVKPAMELITSAENDVEAITKMADGTLTIGASKTIIHEFLMPYITKFHELYPNVKMRIYTGKVNDLVSRVNSKVIDLLFTNLPNTFPGDLTTEVVMNLHDCLVASNKYSFYKDKKIAKKELINLPLLTLPKGTITRSLFDDYCIKNGLRVTPIMEFESNSVIKDFTLAGFGIGMLTEEHIKKELDSGELFKLNINLNSKGRKLGMVYNNSEKDNVLINNFIDIIRNNTNIDD